MVVMPRRRILHNAAMPPDTFLAIVTP